MVLHGKNYCELNSLIDSRCPEAANLTITFQYRQLQRIGVFLTPRKTLDIIITIRICRTRRIQYKLSSRLD